MPTSRRWRCALLGLLAGVACGESGVAPARRVTAVVLSRDSVRLEVGESVALRAEPRDVNGDPVLDAAVSWSALDPAVAAFATTGTTTLVTAHGPGTGRIVARIGARSDTAILSVPTPFTSTTLAVHLDTLEAIGEAILVDVVSQSPMGPRPGRYTVTSRNLGAILADPQLDRIIVSALGPGAGWVVVEERGGTRDSMFIVVHQRPASITLPDSIVGHLGRSVQIAVTVKDARQAGIVGRPLTFESLDTTVATISSAGLVSFVGLGTGALTVAVAPGIVDTSPVTTISMPRLVLRTDSMHTGTGLRSDTAWVAYDDGFPVGGFVHLSITAPAVATVPDSVRFVGDGGTFQVVGRQAGATQLVASAPLMRPDTLHIRVSSARIRVGDVDYGDAHSPLLPLGTDGRFVISVHDSLGVPRTTDTSVLVTIVSTDTTVLKLPQNTGPYVVPPLGGGTPVFPAVPQDTGEAWVVATAPGYMADSLPFTVTTQPALRYREGRLRVVGVRQTPFDPYAATITTTRGWDHGGPIFVTFTRAHPSVVSFPDTVTLPGNALYWPLPYSGLVPGADTIIASAAGYLPDTLVLVVTTPRFLLPDSVATTTQPGFVSMTIADSTDAPHAPGGSEPLRVDLTSADTTVIRETLTRIPAGWSGSWPLPLAAADTGVTMVTVTDSAGLYGPTTMVVSVALDTSLRIIDFDGYQYGPSAPRQRFESGRFRISGPGPRYVWFTTTDPRILRVSDSVYLGNYPFEAVPVVAGDTVGAARIVATAPGFAADTSEPIAVSAGRLILTGLSGGYVGGSTATTVIALNQRGIGLPLDTAASFRLVALDGGLAGDSIAIVSSGQAVSEPALVQFPSPGTFRLAVEDRRAVPVPFDGDTVTVRVAVPPLAIGVFPAPVMAVGQRLFAIVLRPYDLPSPGILVTVVHQGNHTASPATITLPVNEAAVYYPIEGRSVGVDTIIVMAAGYVSDTFTVHVSEGRLDVYNVPGVLPQGDSVLLYLSTGDSLGHEHPVAQATTFTILKDGGITFSNGAQSVSTVTIPAGESTASVFLKAVGPIGTATARFFHLNYVERALQLTVVP